MYFVLALLCTNLDQECMIKAYPHLLPGYEACLIVKNDVENKLWEYAPDNASSVKTWCFMIPEDT